MSVKSLGAALLILATALLPDQQVPVVVKHAGALRNIMHENDLSAKIDLNSLSEREHLYALGALENLKGEILIMDSKPYIATAEDEQVSIEQNFDHKASLLVYSEVRAWKSLEIPDGLEDKASLETFIVEMAQDLNIDTEQAFPFLIEGLCQEVQYHIINWPEGDTEHSHQKHKTSGPHGSLENSKVRVLGFFSRHHTGVFTHHSSHLHLHFISDEGHLAGHVDELALKAGMVLKLPVAKDYWDLEWL